MADLVCIFVRAGEDNEGASRTRWTMEGAESAHKRMGGLGGILLGKVG